MSVRRIVGCPGGGKTRKLSELAARAADRYGPGAVLIASLTKTAATEIGERAAVIADDQTATLHAHALRALGFDHERLAETRPAMREFHAAHQALAPDSGRDDLEDAPAATGGLHAQVANRRARMTPVEDWTDEERDYAAVWEDWKAQTQRKDFTDLIEECLRERIPPLSRPRVILADEAQDFTALEFELLAAWAQDTDSTVMVGDEQQCIYWFRGADPERLTAIPVARGETLEQSYRCPRAVADAAQHWAAQLPGEAVPWKPRDADGSVDEAPFALRDTADVIDHALASVRGGQTTMILASCRYMLTALCAQLREQGVPFANPWATGEAAWNPLGGPGPRALLALLAPTLPDGRMWTWGDLFAFTAPMQATALGRGTKAAIEEHCRVDEFGVSRAAQTVDLGTLATMLGEQTTDRLLGIDRHAETVVDWWRTTLLQRGAKSIDYAVAVWRVSGAGALTAAPALTIGTVHSVKGGEAQHVVLAPELSKEGYYQSWLGGGAGRDACVRMAYVGMTRARESLTIMEPGCPETMPLDDVLRERVAA